MRIPQSPPKFEELLDELIRDDFKSNMEIISNNLNTEPITKYYHWDKLRHLDPPSQQLNHELWWFAIKFARKSLSQIIPHPAKDKTKFIFLEPTLVKKTLRQIDITGGGELKSNALLANSQTREAYLINSLIEESITSSQLEGAVTTRKIAKEMLRQKRRPADNSERMIVNNYHAMEFIATMSKQKLTPELILKIQRIITADTLENPDAVGNFRRNNEFIIGDQRDASTLHVPPCYKEIPERINSICHFANEEETDNYIHPVLRSIILHFLLAYDHPFEDGNGRTARALFYWSMLKHGYWSTEFISISKILKSAPAKYYRSFLYTQTDDNDVTYFIVHQLNVICRAIDELLVYLKRKSDEQNDLQSLIQKSKTLQLALNHRQVAILNRALKNSNAIFTIQSHRGAHNVTYDTARTDLLKLSQMGLLNKSKNGRAFTFTPHPNLQKILRCY